MSTDCCPSWAGNLKTPVAKDVLSGATFPAAPITVQPEKTSPVLKSVNPPAGTGGSSKLPFVNRLAPLPGLHSSPERPPPSSALLFPEHAGNESIANPETAAKPANPRQRMPTILPHPEADRGR